MQVEKIRARVIQPYATGRYVDEKDNLTSERPMKTIEVVPEIAGVQKRITREIPIAARPETTGVGQIVEFDTLAEAKAAEAKGIVALIDVPSGQVLEAVAAGVSDDDVKALKEQVLKLEGRVDGLEKQAKAQQAAHDKLKGYAESLEKRIKALENPKSENPTGKAKA